MSQFFRIWADKKSMLLWNPYISWRYVPAKTTKTGFHEPKVMMSIGRAIKPAKEIDKNKLYVLPESIQKEMTTKFTLETHLKPELTIRDKFFNYILKSYSKIGKTLARTFGIEMEKDDYAKNIEVYQFIKFTEPEELIGVIRGTAMSMGILSKMRKLRSEDATKLKYKLRNTLYKWFDMGYERAE